MGIPHDSGEINWTHTGPEKFEPKVEFFENLTFCPVAPAWVIRSPTDQWPKYSLGRARRSLAPWRSQLEQVWALKIDPQVKKNHPKSAEISQNLKFSEKVENHVFHADMSNFSSSENSDTHFTVEATIFRGLG